MRWLLLLGLAGCAPRIAADPGVLMVEEKDQTASFVRNFNPLLEVGDVRWPATHSMYEPLLIWNPMVSDYVPWLATSYAWSSDHRRLSFTLRAGVRWSDGAQFTARDVAFTFELLRRFEALDLRGVWSFVSDVRAPDDRTVEMSFSRVFVPGFTYLAQQPIVPEHVWKDVADPVSWADPEPVATGPYTEVTRFETQAYEVAKNPYYWQPLAVDSLRFLAFPTNDQANLALIDGELDWAGSFVPAIDRIFSGHYWFPPIDGGVLLYANTTMAPFDDVRVRKALSLAIDRERIVKVAMYDYVRPTDDPYDPDAARALLDEAGVTSLHTTILVPAGFSDWVRAAQVIARNLRAVGIRADVKPYDFNAWYDKVQTGDFALSLGWSEPSPTAYGYYRAMMSSETAKPLGDPAPDNWQRFALPAADERLRALESTADPAEEARLERELAALFAEHAPAIPLFPGPLWGEYSSERFTGFPDEDNPYAPLSPNLAPQALLVLPRLEPR